MLAATTTAGAALAQGAPPLTVHRALPPAQTPIALIDGATSIEIAHPDAFCTTIVATTPDDISGALVRTTNTICR